MSLQGVQRFVTYAVADLAGPLQKMHLEGQGFVALDGESVVDKFIATASCTGVTSKPRRWFNCC